jgi:hypothetical protein
MEVCWSRCHGSRASVLQVSSVFGQNGTTRITSEIRDVKSYPRVRQDLSRKVSNS